MAKPKKEKKVAAPVKPDKGTPWLTGVRAYAVVVFIFSFLIYCNSVLDDYNMDDELVTQNQPITSKGWDAVKLNFNAFAGQGARVDGVELRDSSFAVKLKYFLPMVFRVPYYSDQAGYKYEYRPMVLLSFALEHALFSGKEVVNGADVVTDNPHISHFFNVLLYSLLCVLLFSVLRALLVRYNILFPFIITLFFAAHPIHTEAVASIKNRDELLALIFGLLSLQFSLSWVQQKKIYLLFPVFLFFLFGILSKPTTITFALLIPLSLIMFTTIRFSRLLLITLVLAIPAIFYARLYSILQQIEMAGALFFSVAFFYALKNRDITSLKAKAWWGSIQDFFTTKSIPHLNNVSTLDFGFLRRPGNLAGTLLIILVPLGISAWGVYCNDFWVSCLPLLFFSVLFVFVSDELKLIFITPVTCLALFALLRLAPYSKLFETGLMVFLTGQMFSGDRKFRLVGGINYLVAAAVVIIFHHSFAFMAIVVFAGLFNRKLWWPALIVLMAILLKNAFATFRGANSAWQADLVWLLFAASVFLLWKHKEKLLQNAVAIILPLLLAVSFISVHAVLNHSNSLAVLQTDYYKFNRIKAADLTPVQSVRPLKYVEYPIEINPTAGGLNIKAGTAMTVLGKYLKMVFIPYPMSYYYGYAYFVPVKLTEPWPLVLLLIHLALLGLALYLFNRNVLISYAILFYLISISVFSNLLIPVAGLVGDRYLLIPSLGFCILLAVTLEKLFKQDFRDHKLNVQSLSGAMKMSSGLILLFYSALIFSRNHDWKDRLTLFRHDIGVVENSAQAQNLLALHLFLASNKETDPVKQQQLREEAIPHFKRALEIYPDFLNTSFDLGRTYEAMKRVDDAYNQFAYTVSLDSSFYAPYFKMAVILDNKGKYEAAIPLYQKFLNKYPRQMEAYANLSFAYFRLKEFDKSIATNRRALQVVPHSLNPLINIAKTYKVMNEPDSALYYFEQASLIQPNDPNIRSAIEQLRPK